jgi:hypothetical protein
VVLLRRGQSWAYDVLKEQRKQDRLQVFIQALPRLLLIGLVEREGQHLVHINATLACHIPKKATDHLNGDSVPGPSAWAWPAGRPQATDQQPRSKP